MPVPGLHRPPSEEVPMNQIELPFDAHKLARTTDPSTSKEAAMACKELRGEHHAIVLAVLDSVVDANADEIAARCELDRHQIGRRLNELERAGLVWRTGVTRPTATGRAAMCYSSKRPNAGAS